jgi:uncharacterized protein
MNLLDIVLYFSIAMTASCINSVAGGGTFLTFPLLIINGMTAIQANIVSTIALWPGSVASAIAYRGEQKLPRKQFMPLIIISIAGSIVGTAILLLTPEVVFRQLVPWMLLAAISIFTFGGKGVAWLNQFSSHATPARRFGAAFLQFLIAVYGGYFGAGIGILMLAMLQVMGFSHIHQMNALKTVLGSAINGVAWLIFVFSGRVVWDVALIMLMGAVLGGYIGARVSLRISPDKIRLLVSVIGFSMTAYFFLYGV